MLHFIKAAFGHQVPGMVFDYADEIFAGAAEDYAKLGQGGGDGAEGSEPKETAPENQDVDPNKGQGDAEGAPGTPDESADKTVEDGKQPESTEKKGKVDSVAEVRKWGEGWEQTAKDREKRIGEIEPTIKLVDEKFGGVEGLNIAAEVYGALANEDEFDPANAVEFLSETFPNQAEKLVKYIAQSVADETASKTIENTFGRKLNAQDVKDVQAFLAAGKKADGRKVDTSFLNRESIPDHLKFDSEGNERDSQILDYLWNQQQALKEATDKIESLSGKVTGTEDARRQEAAEKAITEYIDHNFQGISSKISELKLDQPIEGETAEVTELRKTCGTLIEAIVMMKASGNPEFQAMYRKGVEATAKAATNQKDRVAKANSTDFSRRIKAQIDTMTADAASMISVLIDSVSEKRAAQVKKVKEAPTVGDAPGGHQTPPKERDPGEDPFDSASIWNEVNDKLRASGKRF